MSLCLVLNFNCCIQFTMWSVSWAWCTVSQHSRHNTWLHEYIVDKNNGIKQSLTKSMLWNTTNQVSNDWQVFNLFFKCKQCCKLCVSCVYGLTQGDGQLWENNMEKTSHNQISCLKCCEGVCVHGTQLVQQKGDFLLQAQWFTDEHQEGHSRNHVTQTWQLHG